MTRLLLALSAEAAMACAARIRVVAACLAALSPALFAAPVVVTPGTLATNMFSHGATNSTSPGPVETLNTCYVTPSADDKTIVMSSRPWRNYTKPVTVFYKMVGGGAANTGRPQLDAAGGSSAILKNGSLIAAANGMNAGGTGGTVVSGSFTVTSNDTLRFVVGGGAGAGTMAYYYAAYCDGYDADGNYYGYYTFQWYGYTGGGGAGYYGGGAGQYYQSSCAAPGAPGVLSGIATGGTGIAGGVGAPGAGSLGIGGANTNSGWDGGAGGTSAGPKVLGMWSGYANAYYQIGGGGNKGQPGVPGGSVGAPSATCPWPADTPASMPLATTYDLDSKSGKLGYGYSGMDPYGYPYNCTSGGGRGQIVLRYQAITCELIPQYNAP
jgi:hypothetical protein